MLEQNKKIVLAGEEALSALREIEFILLSLHKMGSHYSDNPVKLEEYRKATTDFIDNFEVTKRLAKVRTIISKSFDESIGDDDMDDIERYLLDLKLWSPESSEKSLCKIETVAFSDGTIEQITSTRNELLMVFTDWQEQSLLITFHDLIAFQGLCAVGCEIGEMYEEETSTLSEDAARVDPDETGTSYFFKASNGDAVVLIIVAKGYSVERI